MSTPQSLIIAAFFNLGATAEGETPSAAELADGLVRLNQMLGSWSTEGATVFTETVGTFALTAGQNAFTMGVGGSWVTTVRAQKITAWRASAGVFTSGGSPLSFPDFDQAAHAASVTFATTAAKVAALEAELVAQVTAAMAPFFLAPTAISFPNLQLAGAAVPMILGADTAWPLLNVRVFPASVSTGSVEVTYWTPIAEFATLGETVAMPPGFEDAIQFNLAISLAPQYARQTGVDPALAAKAQQTKASIVQMNTIQQQVPQAPQVQAQ